MILLRSSLLRSGPQAGIGVALKDFKACNRSLSIHSGSFFSFDIFRTTDSESPGSAWNSVVPSFALSYLDRSMANACIDSCVVVVSMVTEGNSHILLLLDCSAPEFQRTAYGSGRDILRYGLH